MLPSSLVSIFIFRELSFTVSYVYIISTYLILNIKVSLKIHSKLSNLHLRLLQSAVILNQSKQCYLEIRSFKFRTTRHSSLLSLLPDGLSVTQFSRQMNREGIRLL